MAAKRLYVVLESLTKACDSLPCALDAYKEAWGSEIGEKVTEAAETIKAVSYTHLTLPTILRV